MSEHSNEMDDAPKDKSVFLVGLSIGIVASVIVAGFFVLGLFTGKFLAENSARSVNSSAMQMLGMRYV